MVQMPMQDGLEVDYPQKLSGKKQHVEKMGEFAHVEASGIIVIAIHGKLNPIMLDLLEAFQRGVSPYGVYDMAGNAFEWVADWYQNDYYKISPLANPKGPSLGGFKVMRGGAWVELPNELRCAFRFGGPPDSTDSRTGFRIAKDR